MALEQLAERYERHHRLARGPGFAVAARERSQLFSSVVGTGKDVLDLGCRDGTMAQSYLVGNRITGIDCDREALERARAAGLRAVWGDLSEPLPFPVASFDVAIAGELLEHVPDPAGLVAEISRVLRPRGALVGSVPNAYRLKNRLRVLAGKEFDRDPTHLHQFSPRTLRRLLDGDFVEVKVSFHSSRLLKLSPALFGNTLTFSARKPGEEHAR